MEKIEMTADDGTKQEFYIEAETRMNGTDYLLVSDGDPDEAEALILKNISDETCEEAEYVVVEDETELNALLSVFAEDLDEDTDLEM